MCWRWFFAGAVTMVVAQVVTYGVWFCRWWWRSTPRSLEDNHD